jgi:hypothetical protein
MFDYYIGGPAQYLPVGVLVVFSFLLIYTVLTSVFRLSKKWNSAFVFILIAAVFGIINGACLLYFSTNGTSPDYRVLIAVVLFALAIGPMAWVSVFGVFSAITGKSIQVKLAYLLTFIQIVLIITAAALYGVHFNNDASYIYTYVSLFTAIIALRWTYFLLFLSLIVRYRQQLNGLNKTVLIAFGILSTGRQIAETIFFLTNVGYDGTSVGYIFIVFFFTDFLAAVTMFLLVTFYKNLTVKNDHMYDS